jgi:hypothetical protein
MKNCSLAKGKEFLKASFAIFTNLGSILRKNLNIGFDFEYLTSRECI